MQLKLYRIKNIALQETGIQRDVDEMNIITNKTDRHDLIEIIIVESGVKHHKHNPYTTNKMLPSQNGTSQDHKAI